jgi:hypothetical protein
MIGVKFKHVFFLENDSWVVCSQDYKLSFLMASVIALSRFLL